MASSKLKIKPIDRDNLYFNKYLYRVYISAPNLYWVQYMNDIDEYCNRLAEEHENYLVKKDDKNYWPYYRERYTPDPVDYPLITYLIDIRKTYYKKNKNIGMRYEGNTICVYTNELSIVESIVAVKPEVKINQANVAPKGVKYFKNDPPAKYRAYMTSNRVPAEFRNDMLQYLQRTPDLRPSKSFETFLNRNMMHRYDIWLWNNYFLDYDDDRNLMMLMLMFPGAIGKTYKLEKK